MIYAAKPQRGGRSIPTNTNNPPQDPPPPPNEIPLLENEVFIPIENTAPPVPEIEIVESVIDEINVPEPVIETIKETPKLSIWNKLLNRIKKIWSKNG